MSNSNYNTTNRAAQWAAEAAETDRLERQAKNELQAEAEAINAEGIILSWFDARDEYLAAARTAETEEDFEKATRLAWAAEDMAIRWSRFKYDLLNPSRKAIKDRAAEIRQREEMEGEEQIA